MDGSLCDICFKNYCEKDCIPKVLRCGHTICTDCLSKILQSQKACPTCKTDLAESDAESYPNNFALLTLLANKPKKLECSDVNFSALEELKGSFLLCKTKLIADKEERIILENIISHDLTRIQQKLDFKMNSMEKKSEADLLITELKANLEKVNKVIHCINLKNPIALSQHKDSTHFLYDISSKLHKKEKLYVVGKVEGQLKYGKISSEGDYIIVHSMSLSQVEKKDFLISLEDLRKCGREHLFYTFIEILFEEGRKKVFFEMIKTEPLSWHFIKLCTGESGPTYKGSDYKHVMCPRSKEVSNQYGQNFMEMCDPVSGSINVDNYMINDEAAEGPMDYWFQRSRESDTVLKKCGYGGTDLYLRGSANGAFQIIISKVDAVDSSSNKLGDVHKPGNINFRTCKESKISDCGFALKIY